MLQITIPSVEFFDEQKQEFFSTKEQVLQLEHSLISLSKWESKWNKAFLSKKEKTFEETLDYIRCMTLTQNVNPDVYKYMTDENIRKINEYIDKPMTATFFPEEKRVGPNREQVTAELIYYWLVALQIPFDPCQKWHLNRLLALVQVCNRKNQPVKKLSKRELMQRNAALNESRRKQLNTRG